MVSNYVYFAAFSLETDPLIAGMAIHNNDSAQHGVPHTVIGISFYGDDAAFHVNAYAITGISVHDNIFRVI